MATAQKTTVARRRIQLHPFNPEPSDLPQVAACRDCEKPCWALEHRSVDRRHVIMWLWPERSSKQVPVDRALILRPRYEVRAGIEDLLRRESNR